ncbi:MAG TPA: FAD-dependent oxidoreductase [Candidatus Saccharimonadales bacterium]|nr:FAD-dependent oxidoreductase [Candidatus Saccharimonadales bacterium]
MKFGILGAGPSGLAMSMFLNEENTVLEKTDQPGGHAGSFIDQGYTFDYGPHIMFSKNKEILDFMIASLGKNVQKLKRNNKISFKGKFIKYPFENDLSSLPIEDNFECLNSFLFNPYKTKYKNPKNLEEWLLATFGSGICERYLFPYNEKVWNIPVKNLSMLWAGRIPNPPVEDVIKSSIGFQTEGYLHQLYYHYPLRGGYQAISEAWAKKVKPTYNFEVKKITKTKKNSFIVSDGEKELEFNQIISTLPIQELVKLINIKIPQKVQRAIKDLIVNPMFIVSLGIKGEDKNKYTAMYFPEKDFLVNRISFPKTFSHHNAPKGHYSIQAEITCRANSSTWKMSDKEILNHVVAGLRTKGVLGKNEKVVYENVKRAQYAYVVYDKNYQKNVRIIREWFPLQGIHLVGRFSYFEYINIDGVLATASSITHKITGSNKNHFA